MKLILFVFVGVDQVIVEMTWKTQNVDEKLRTWSQFNEAHVQAYKYHSLAKLAQTTLDFDWFPN